jgi:PPM family protein phosphatase
MASTPFMQTGPSDGGNFECQWQGPYLQVHVLTDIGRKRSRNEDACTVCAPEEPPAEPVQGALFAVADGMGGVHGGEFASRLALQTLAAEYFSDTDGDVPKRLRQAVEKANQRIFEEAENNPDYRGMGTTVSAMLILGDHAYVAHVGDSRIYLKRGNKTYQLTRDHSLVAEQVRSGLISEEEARTHALKNLITRAVGTKDHVKVDLHYTPIRKDDTFMICSDGLCGVVEEDEIDNSLGQSSVQGVARVLVGRALEHGGPDNVSVLVVRVTGVPPRSELHAGAERVKLSPNGLFGRLRNLLS